jgi:PAN domain
MAFLPVAIARSVQFDTVRRTPWRIAEACRPAGERNTARESFTPVHHRPNLLLSVPSKARVKGVYAAEGDKMPQSRQIAGWVIIGAVALIVQGCWEDEQLSLLGEGGCRLADGSTGDPMYLSGLSSDQCQAECLGEDGKCTAVEFNTNNGQCEIHSEPIVKYESVQGVFCYVRD